jgi:aspartyl/asparaginyl-tRNA synthetase
VFLTACSAAYSFNTSTKIKDILDHPRDYEGRDITINGTVTNTVSLLVIKYYEIQDGTGSIKIITDKLLPSRGEKLTVTGRMAVVELGTERWVMLRESQDAPGQYFGSEKHDDLTDNNQQSKY